MQSAMTKAGTAKLAAVLLGLVLTICINFHSYFANFNLVPGDRGDARLVIFTLEHWLNVLKGHEPFYWLGMFFPGRLALGYADGLFIFAPPYALFRVLGFDTFTSYQLLFPFLTAVGYAAWILVLRRALQLNMGFSVLGSVLLTCLNALQFQAEIGKLLAFHFYPVLIGLLWMYYASANKANWKAWSGLGLFAIGLGLLFFTSYYPAWFFLFTLLLFTVVRFAASALETGLGATLLPWSRFARANWLQLAAALFLLVLALVPFATTYAPLVLSDSHRSFSLVLDFAPSPRDIINVSSQNYVWSPILENLHFKFGNREVQMGSPLLVLALFVFFLVGQAANGLRRNGRTTDGREGFVFLLSMTALVIFGLTVKVHDLSLWQIVYRLVPGASALRALGRYFMVIDMIVVVAVMYGLDQRFRRYGGGLGGRRLYMLLGTTALLAVGLIVEQANATPFRLDKAEQLALLAKYQAAPAECEAFFINNAPDPALPPAYYQLDAMMISMNLGLPTVNGYSGLTPNEVFDMVPAGIEYKYKILKWLHMNHVENRVCELDYQTAAFQRVDLATEYPRYEQLNRASYLESFNTLFSAATRFLADKNELANLYPQYLEEHGYLDGSWGYKAGPAYRWIQDRYWMGERVCGAEPCFGIGVLGSAANLRAIRENYESLAARIYFPYPAVFIPGTAYSDELEGELLMLFRAQAGTK
jgi:hypothetical protein